MKPAVKPNATLLIGLPVDQSEVLEKLPQTSRPEEKDEMRENNWGGLPKRSQT